MQRHTAVIVSTQTMFAIDNMTSGSYISLTPPLYGKVERPGQDAVYDVIHGIGAGSIGGRFFTNVVTNNYGMDSGYNAQSLSLSMKTDTIEYSFLLTKIGNQITCESLANGTLDLASVLYEDIVGAVYLRARSAPDDDKAKTMPVAKDDVYSMVEFGNYGRGLTITESSKSLSKTIPDTEMFSLLQNVDLYISGPLYQLINGDLVRVESRRLEGQGKWGGFFALSGDRNELYPDGTTELIVNDGFSEGRAVIEFKHDSVKKLVTITINSHTSKVCDIRDLTEVGYPFPNTLCFAL
ncbi:hypothetical protein [Pseudomonas sp. R151218B TE3479]